MGSRIEDVTCRPWEGGPVPAGCRKSEARRTATEPNPARPEEGAEVLSGTHWVIQIRLRAKSLDRSVGLAMREQRMIGNGVEFVESSSTLSGRLIPAQDQQDQALVERAASARMSQCHNGSVGGFPGRLQICHDRRSHGANAGVPGGPITMQDPGMVGGKGRAEPGRGSGGAVSFRPLTTQEANKAAVPA